MSKKWLMLSLLLLSFPLALADAMDVLGNVWDRVLSIGNLSFLGTGDNALVGLTRILLGFLIFTLIFAVITVFGKSEHGSKSVLGFFNRGQAGLVAAIMATISAIFLPASVVLATGASWATAIALLLIGGPIVGLALLLWKYPKEGKETKATVALKIILCFLLLWILNAVKYHVMRIAA